MTGSWHEFGIEWNNKSLTNSSRCARCFANFKKNITSHSNSKLLQAITEHLNQLGSPLPLEEFIPDHCYGHQGRCQCKNILSGVKLSRLNTKTAYILLFRDIFECFGVFLVNFRV